MPLELKIQTLNLMVADFANKLHLNNKYLSVQKQNHADRSSEVEKMTGLNSSLAIRLRQAILEEIDGDFASYLATSLSLKLNAMDHSEFYLSNTSGDQLKVDISESIAVPASIVSILNERSALIRSIFDAYSTKLLQSSEYVMLQRACDESKFKSIDPFNCVKRCFASAMVEEFEGTKKGELLISHGSIRFHPNVKPVDQISRRYVGMGEYDYSIGFSDEEGSFRFWDVNWSQCGEATTFFSLA
ncbi:hypothetical protein OTK49_01230 [Vibrio coralliirubri]|uniref:hypothetical protein n=1 Tax=Vibrio coralliirubri TaxID=1516159 RepID=UPI002283BE32|nr:hypothetical protein [Vibrio coralliirubri]MCY9861152.1 hypothetical protein [Vibrio coralliirubri]